MNLKDIAKQANKVSKSLREDAPPSIFLQIIDDYGDPIEKTWSVDRVYKNDVEYLRRDLVKKRIK